MENVFDRLQFVKGLNPQREDGIFNTREDAVNYVLDKQVVDRPTVVAEPIVLLYESDSASKGPNVILAIGSVGKGTPTPSNRTFFIDTQKTEEEIIALDEKIEAAIKSLTIIPLDSDTINLETEKTDDGTIVSGDVKIADYRIIDGKVNYNIIQVEEGKGIYAFVDMDYDPDTFVITFNVNGVTKEFQLPTDQHLVKGWYDPKEESLFFKLADDSQVRVPVTKLIEEWTVLPDGQTINDYNVSGTTVNFTPIVFAKTHVGSKETEHEGIYEWQDVLEADIRVADHISDNIIHKDRTGRYLYVKGTADNIKYKDGLTVKDALDNVDTRVSTSAGNLIYKRPDGIYAAAMLDYNVAENKLVYTYSDGNSAEIKSVEFKLNSVKILEDITYDPVKEVIVIRYIDAQGEYQRVEIPASDIIEEWEVDNEAHNIQLNKYRSEGKGKDILTADAKIHVGNNNILEDLNHELYVNGISNNIKYDVTGATTVKDVLDNLSATTDSLNDKIDQEIADRTDDVERIDTTIGSGFTTDAHETVTYKFEQLQNKVNEEAEKLQNEIDRSTSADTVHDGRLDAIDAEIGDGFGPRNTVRDEIDNLQSEIDAVSADTSMRLTDVINEDKSIDVETRNDENDKPTIKVLKVNLSEEVEDNKPNIIKLNTDGLYAGVDLIYEFNEEVGTNQLIFKTTNSTKVYDLKTNSVVDKIYYDPSREAIIIEYTINGHRMPDVVIPVGDLINEWRVEDGHPHAVQLEKVRSASGTTEQDVLKASVIITDDHDDNILVMDDGALYVSGAQISANTAAIEQEIADRMADVDAEEARAKAAEEALGDRLTVVENDINSIENGLNNEISARTLADEALGRRIDQEISDRIADVDAEEARAISAENALSNKIDADVLAERNRAMSAETALDNKISNEETRATTAESNLSHKIDDEETRAKNKENEIINSLNDEITRSTAEDTQLANDLSEEIERSKAADSALTTNLQNEIVRAYSAETELSNRINNVSGNLESEITRSTAADTQLTNDLNAEVTRSTNKDQELTDAINDEVTRAQSAETALQTAIGNEKTRAEGEESRIEHLLEDEISRSTTKDTELQTQINSNTSNIENEVNRAKNAESALTSSLQEEIERARLAEQAISDSLTGETERAEAQEAYLLHLISDETAARISGDTILSERIATEITRAGDAENRLETLINNETSRAQSAETALQTAITNETLRAQAADNELYQKIADETAERATKDAELESLISQETSRAKVIENVISGMVESEIARSTAEDTRLSNELTAETAARQTKDAELEQAIRDSKLTFEDSTSIDFNNPYLEDNIVKANVKLQEGDNIIKIGSGLYASVHLSYDPGTNKIKLVTSNGEDEEIQLVGASLLEDLHYDATNKQLVITYKDATGVEHTVNFGVSELFNEWSVNNPSEKSAVELTKTPSAEPGGEDKLSGRVLITDDRDGDGKPDDGSDNIIEIRNNGLYVSGSAMTESKETAECVENELKQVEKALFGFIVSEECGSGFTYTPIPGTTYINTAVTVNNATFILDQTIKNLSSYTENVENKVNIVSGDTECVKKEVKSVEKAIFGNEVSDCGEDFTYTPPIGTRYINSATTINNATYILDQSINNLSSYTTSAINVINSAITEVEEDVECVDDKASKIYELLYGEGKSMPDCGEGSVYHPYVGSCIISAATSFEEADKLLSDGVCSILQMWTSGVTPSTSSNWAEDGANRKFLVDVRVSHGNHNGMTDDELEIRSNDGVFIDTDTTEFTDTNVVRIVHITDGPDHTVLPDDNPYNGVYVSNVWDCGMYYGPTDTEAKAAAEAAGYNTNYSTDENSSASSYNYMNNVRQDDI